MLDKLKLILDVLLDHKLWKRNHKADKMFDKIMIKMMDDGVQPGFAGEPNPHEIMFGPFTVWISNAPYADVSVNLNGEDLYASRTTALRFRRLLASSLVDEDHV